MKGLLQTLASVIPITDSFRHDLEKVAITMSLPKFHHLVEAPKVPAFVYFLERGFAITYIYENGKKQIEKFWRGGQPIILTHSFCKQQPSLQFLQLMETSEVIHLNYADIGNLLANHPTIAKLYQSILLDYLKQTEDRLRDHQQLAAHERHKKLLEQFPGIEQIVPQEYIASYLGVTPQSLSRIKKTRAR